jgi:hypothetical protein
MSILMWLSDLAVLLLVLLLCVLCASVADGIAWWWHHPAKRWEFWYPQSGLFGGLVAGFVAIVIVWWVLGLLE